MLKYYTIQVVYSSIGSTPVLDSRCVAASSSHSLPPSSSQASRSNSIEELMRQDTLPSTKIPNNAQQLNNYHLIYGLGFSFFACSNNANMVALVFPVLCNSHFYSCMISTSMCLIAKHKIHDNISQPISHHLICGC